MRQPWLFKHLLVLSSPPLNSSLLDFMLSWWAVAAVLFLPCGLSYHVHRLYKDVTDGQHIVLPCDGSAFRDEEGMVWWEQLGETVVVLRGAETSVAESLRGRVQLPSEEQIRNGNWSLVISSVTLNDDNVYHCFFNNSTLISSIWVRVLEKDADDSTTKTLWITDGSGGGTTDLPFPMEASTQTIKGTTDKLTTLTDFQSVWTTDESTTFKDSLSVGTTDESTTFKDSLSVGTTDESTTFKDSLSVGTTDESTTFKDSLSVGTTDESTTFKDSLSVGTTDESTTFKDSLSVGTTDESTTLKDSQSVGTTYKSTPFSDRDDPKATTDSPLLESFPWVRFGLIGGVLLVTSLVMGLLGALRQI